MKHDSAGLQILVEASSFNKENGQSHLLHTECGAIGSLSPLQITSEEDIMAEGSLKLQPRRHSVGSSLSSLSFYSK
jgi:hypothetical protein